MRADAPLAHHFDSLETQQTAARFGMWLFLTTEILLFAGLFVAYGLYRYFFPATFIEGSHHLHTAYGAVNTVVLITSSLTVAMAVHYARTDRPRLTAWMLLLSIAMGFAFLGIKAVEYGHHIHDGALPGPFFHLEGFQAPYGGLFFSLYFLATGLHAIHVVIGMSILAWAAWRAWKGSYSSAYYTPIELSGMYWHLVDLVWIYLFPLLYLA